MRDALTIDRRRGEDLTTPHTRPPTDEDADHVLVRTALCLDGNVEVELVCEPRFDYGRVDAEWGLADGDRSSAIARGAGTRARQHDAPRGAREPDPCAWSCVTGVARTSACRVMHAVWARCVTLGDQCAP